MWRITIRGIVAQRARYALTGLAVILGVAFVAGTLVFTDTIGHTFDQLYGQIYQRTAAVVRSQQAFNPGVSFSTQRQPIDASLQATINHVPGVQATALDIEGYAQLVGRDGKPLGHPVNGPPTVGMAWMSVSSLNPLQLRTGAPPATPSEIVIDQNSANVGHFHVGDRVTVLTHLSPATYVISGIATWGSAASPLGATIVAFTPATAARDLGQPGKVNQINVGAVPGVSETDLAARIRAAIHDPTVQVVTGQQVASEGENAVHNAFSSLNTLLLIFAGIALFVGSLLIFNTFSLVLAQRTHEVALLRAVGATRRQVTMAVAGESALLGLLASALGVAAGVGLAQLLKAGMGLLGYDIPATGIVLSPTTAIVAICVGTAVTTVAAIGPARRAARTPPVVAMQSAVSEEEAFSTRRIRRGVRLTVIGLAVFIVGLVSHATTRTSMVALGGLAIVIGLTRLGPIIAKPAARMLGAPFAHRTTSGVLARSTAMRHPSRTSSTATALMIGVGMVSLITVTASSQKATADAVIGSSVRADYIISSNAAAGSSYGFSPALGTSVAKLPEVGATAATRSGIAKIYSSTVTIDAVDTTHADQLFDVGVTKGHIPGMAPTGIAVSTAAATTHHLVLGSPVKVTFPTTGPKTFTVQAVYSQRQLAGDYVLPLAAARANFPQQLDTQLYIKLAPGADPASARRAIAAVAAAYPNAVLQDQTQYKAQQAAQVNQTLNLVYGLLALAVIIALIGIANTLALSIRERTHELGVLRAVGMTRRQLRSSVRTEALIISVYGALEGLVLGTLIGAAIIATQHAQGAVLSIPVLRLTAIAVIAGLAGLLAAWSPSRRAAHLDILSAVTTE